MKTGEILAIVFLAVVILLILRGVRGHRGHSDRDHHSGWPGGGDAGGGD